MAGGAGAGAGTMAAGAGTGVGTMAAGHGTGAGTMAVWAGSGAGTMAAGHGTGTRNHGCVGWYWSTVPWLCGPALEHGTMAAGTATGVGTMAAGAGTGAGTMAAGAGTGAGTMAAGAPAGILALRLLETFWRLRGPPEARRDPKKGLSHSGNKLQSQGLLATSRRTSFRISELLNRVPRQMLLLLKTNDLLRGIENTLQTRASSSSFINMSRCCILGSRLSALTNQAQKAKGSQDAPYLLSVCLNVVSFDVVGRNR
ncbi:hypothetical protein F7725_007471 [Dissostichus mawsoni]|uniref:Uncharacterized protein n=1 Tax=Dissostichus mawsoni TaxID=36200 RepID=A0A7J5Y7J9_DISMA|nr:hypothetical protein F7725_007471 [Dissostichus mawsoni]